MSADLTSNALRVNRLEDEGLAPSDIFKALSTSWKSIIGGALLFACAAFGIASLMPPIYTARTTLLPPQQQQSAAAAALSSLGALAGLAGSAGAIKSPADQYVALMQSATLSDLIIDKFKLQDVYEEKFRQDTRKTLAKNVQMSVGKKDGMIAIEVDDTDPKRAADIANSYVAGLRTLTNRLAVSEAQQRRAFFETQLKQTRDNLTSAQLAMQGSGITQGALKAEPKAAAEGYAKLRAEVTAAEIRLQSMRRMLTDSAPELEQQQAVATALRAELSRVEQHSSGRQDSDYISKYREFKYQETLFELFARQYELARVDESREGALIQVVDAATPPERKSKPMRGLIALSTGIFAVFVFSIAAVAFRR